MKILLGLNTPWVGGTRIHVITLAKALLDHGHQVTVVTDPGVLEEELRAKEIPFIRRSDGFVNMLRLLLQILEEERPDLIHAHPHDFILEGCLAGELTKIPVVVTMHGEYLMHFTQDSLGRVMSQRVQKVFAVSDGVRDYLLANSPLSSRKIQVVPNLVEPAQGRPIPGALDQLKREFGVGPKELIVMYIGRLDSDKAQAITGTVAALKELAQRGVPVKGIFVGRGSLEPELRSQPGVVLAGFRRDLNLVLPLADVVVAAGRSALEAMAVGRPVLAAGRAGYLGIIDVNSWRQGKETNFGDHGRPPEFNQASFTYHLKLLLEQQELREKLGAYVREAVLEDYSSEKVLARLICAYEDILPRRAQN